MSYRYLFNPSKIQGLDSGQWSRVKSVFRSKGLVARVTPEELTSRAKISRGASLAILAAMHLDGAINLRLHVYHSCRSSPVETHAFGAKLPNYPWKCPCCGVSKQGPSHRVVEDLRYQFVGRILLTTIGVSEC